MTNSDEWSFSFTAVELKRSRPYLGPYGDEELNGKIREIYEEFKPYALEQGIASGCIGNSEGLEGGGAHLLYEVDGKKVGARIRRVSGKEMAVGIFFGGDEAGARKLGKSLVRFVHTVKDIYEPGERTLEDDR